MRGVHIFEKPCYRGIHVMRGRAMRGLPVLAKLFCSFDMCQYLLLYGVVRTYIAKLLYTSDKQFMNATSCYMTLLLLAL